MSICRKNGSISTERSALGNVARVVLGAIAPAIFLGGVGGGCLSRPVTSEQPTSKDAFTNQLRQQSIDKVDLLFDIDDSASMGDKQAYLSAAVPDLLTRLLSPFCVDVSGKQITGSDDKPLRSDADGNCTRGQAEFPPVHDLHIGVVTSSLGARGGNISGCEAGSAGDTKSELVNRGATSATGSPTTGGDAGAIAVTNPSHFLAWFPPVVANENATASAGATALTDVSMLEADFSDLIAGVGQGGCGIESQLESWYRFLIQPDPYDSIVVNGNVASWSGVDATILKQRHDFLRPDSLVAIITLTDENDSEADVRSVAGSGYQFMRSDIPPARGTSACDTNPASPDCKSCGISSTNQSDPNCRKGSTPGKYTDDNDWGFDPNLRHVHAKAKYGVDYQFPIQRYVTGLTKTKIADRNGEYPAGASDYQGERNRDCTNPLFAATLPDGSMLDQPTLCNLPLGPRTADLVFFGIIAACRTSCCTMTVPTHP